MFHKLRKNNKNKVKFDFDIINFDIAHFCFWLSANVSHALMRGINKNIIVECETSKNRFELRSRVHTNWIVLIFFTILKINYFIGENLCDCCSLVFATMSSDAQPAPEIRSIGVLQLSAIDSQSPCA